MKRSGLLICVLLYFSGCINLSGEIKKSFEKINASTEKSVKQLEEQQAALYEQARKNGLPDTAATQAAIVCEETIKYIDTLKHYLAVKNDQDPKIVKQLFFDKGKGRRLHDHMEKAFIACCAAIAGKQKIVAAMSWEENKSAEVWVRQYFEDVPVYAAATVLSKFQLDVRKAVHVVLEDASTPDRR